jgi:hypothetical protein
VIHQSIIFSLLLLFPLNDRLVHLRVSTVARRRKFQGGAFSAMGSVKASVDSSSWRPSNKAERESSCWTAPPAGNGGRRPCPEPDENRGGGSSGLTEDNCSSTAVSCDGSGERRRMSWGVERGGREGHTHLSQARFDGILVSGEEEQEEERLEERTRPPGVRECRGSRNLFFILRIFTHSF